MTKAQSTHPVPGFQIPPVRAATLIRAGAGKVWDALSTRDGWENWFCNRALLDFRAGGFIHFRWKDFGPDRYTGDSRAELLDIAERKSLSFAWTNAHSGLRTIVKLTLEPRGPITVVRLEETGWGTDVQAALNNSGGWGACLEWLKLWVEHGIRFDGRQSVSPPRMRRRVDARKPASRRR